MKKTNLNLITISICNVFFLSSANISFAINPNLDHDSVIRYKLVEEDGEMIVSSGSNKESNSFFTTNSQYKQGNQDSQNIDGGWNCNNYIVHKEPIYILGCPTTDENGNVLGNTYRYQPDNLSKKEILFRWVGLYKNVEQYYQHNKYQKNGNQTNENYFKNNLNKFRIPMECKWTGMNNSYQYLLENNVRIDNDTKSKYYENNSQTISSKNSSEQKRLFGYYKKPSTNNKHQLLKVDEARDATGKYEKCYPKCDKIQNLLSLDGKYTITEVLKCVRGEGNYFKRAKVNYRLPYHITEMRSGITYIKPEECEKQEPRLERNGGLYDINTCRSNAQDINTFFSYKDDMHYASIEKAEQLTGLKIPKNRTDRILKVSINGETPASNIISKKFINSHAGSNLNAIYNALFDKDNIDDMVQFKIVLTKNGMNNILADKKQKIFGYEIHDFYEKSFEKKINYCKNPDPNLYTNPPSCANKEGEKRAYDINNDYNNNMAFGVILTEKSELNSDGFSLKKLEDLNGEYALNPINAYVFQKNLHNNCKTLGFFNNLSYFTNLQKGKAYLQCEDLNSKPTSSSFTYTQYNWSDNIDEIDITDQVKRGQIPHVYYLNNDNRQKGEFAVKFVISYKQTKETENEMPNKSFEW